MMPAQSRTQGWLAAIEEEELRVSAHVDNPMLTQNRTQGWLAAIEEEGEEE